MVKRKANISIDEWLEGGVSTPETSQATAAAAKEESAQTHGPAAEVAPEPAPAEPVIVAVADVAVQGEEESNWFWVLLEQSVYERGNWV